MSWAWLSAMHLSVSSPITDLSGASGPAEKQDPPASCGETLTENSLRGEIEKIVYQKEDSDFTVVTVRDAAGERHCVVGDLFGAAPGEGMEAVGRWIQHKEFGRQFRVDSFDLSLPVTVEGIRKYLSSGVVEGLGKTFADKIVDTFGADTLDVIEKAPARLLEIPRFGKKRVAAVKKFWAENGAKRKIQLHLQSLGITPAFFSKIYSVYGDTAPDKIHENPYVLAKDVKGIGFLMADRIAEKSGIEKNSPRRLSAGIDYALSKMRSGGHVCMPRPQFVRQCAELLKVTEPEAETALDTAVSLLQAMERKAADGTRMIYEPGLLRCETELPMMIATLASVPRHAGLAMSKVPVEPGSRFSEEQLKAVNTVIHSPFSIITGGPGVGKTTVVSEIVRRAGIAKLQVLLAAPTGRAAKRMSETTGMEASTLHRLLKWDPVQHKFVRNASFPLSCDLLIVDETSMLDIMIATALFRAVKPGTTVVLVGDADQLPSVGPGNVLNDLISSRLVPVSRLTKIFRQGSGSGIILAAHQVNAGVVPRLSRPGEPLTDFYWIEKNDPMEAADVIERLVCDRIPARFGFDPMTDIQVLSPMNKGECGTANLNLRLQAKLNSEDKPQFKAGERIFRLGDKLMQTANNYDKAVFNGDMGRLESIDMEKSTFTVKFDSQTVQYEFFEASQLVHSYAVTIHKSQGSEFPAVVIPMLTQHAIMLRRNLLYTGMTRAKKLMILVASRKAVSMAVDNALAEVRYTLFEDRLRSCFAEKGIR